MTPNNIDRYEVRGEIGRGGMATVLKGYDPRFRRDVAIKLLPREFLHDPQFRARFQREAQTIAALEHPAIVPVYDFGDADGQLYLVMRLMTGGSLAERLEKGPLSITETARIFERLAPALDSAHALGIIHRDLKPANILFDQWNNPYLSDFGIAKLVAGSSTALTATGGLVGTPAYMSPEQVRGVDELDGRSDIYAMGVILFQMLTGKLPYNANTPIGLAFMHVTEPVPNILDSNSVLPHTYQAVIEQAMAKERAARPQTTVKLADTVSRLALGRGDNRTNLYSEAKETIVEPMPERVETEQLETTEPKLADTTNLPLTALEDELHQDKWGKDHSKEKPQGAVLPQPVTELDESTGRRVPVWGWGVLGLIVVAALIGLSMLGNGRDEHAGEVVNTAVAAVTLVPTDTSTSTATATSEPLVVPTSTAVPTLTSTSLPTNTPQPTATNLPTNTATPRPTNTPQLGVGSTRVATKDGMVQVFVPAGEFQMGSNDGAGNERPIHTVYLDDYWIDQTEVTNRMYAQCVADGNCRLPDSNESDTRTSYYGNAEFANFPVVYVSWEDANTYCEWAGRRLPTEAEWEKAAAWDAEKLEARTYPWGDGISCDLANFSTCVEDTSKVGSYPMGASFYGALDMTGNVWEWVNDWYDSTYYQTSPTQNPQGPESDSGNRRVIRGGYRDAYISRVAFRSFLISSDRDDDLNLRRKDDLGFRCVQE